MVSSWLETEIEYSGYGCAVFEDPEGEIRGPAKASFDEYGNYSVQMKIEDVKASDPLPGLWNNVQHILTGQAPVKLENRYIWGGPYKSKGNSCSSLSIRTLDGTWSVIGKINFDHLLGSDLRFYIIKSKFEPFQAYNPYYWVMPLSNFVSNFCETDESLIEHPLRVNSTRFNLNISSRGELPQNPCLDNSTKGLIVFDRLNSKAFIEALNDYEERKTALKSGNKNILLTAIMVGNVDVSITEIDSDSGPTLFLPLLGIATGSSVGTPWIEIRNERGELVRRIHQSSNYTPYRAGHVNLHNYYNSQKLSSFLTCAQSSEPFDKNFFLSTCALATESGFFKHNIVDSLANIFRAFDILCKEYNLAIEDLGNQLNSEQKSQIKAVLSTARDEIRKISLSIENPEENFQKRNIEKISERVVSAAWGKVNDSGLAIGKLIEHFGFKDLDVMASHYSSNPRGDKKSWHQLVSYCRGISIHDIRIKDDDLKDLLEIMAHLYDILIRIILHLSGYTGKYTTVFSRYTSEEVDLNWVDADTPASKLGYE